MSSFNVTKYVGKFTVDPAMAYLDIKNSLFPAFCTIFAQPSRAIILAATLYDTTASLSVRLVEVAPGLINSLHGASHLMLLVTKNRCTCGSSFNISNDMSLTVRWSTFTSTSNSTSSTYSHTCRRVRPWYTASSPSTLMSIRINQLLRVFHAVKLLIPRIRSR